MKVEKTNRGFTIVLHEKHPNEEMTRLLQESSAIGGYEDSCTNPGSSYLWVGQDHHLNREEIEELIEKMQYWLKTSRLKI